MFARLQVLDHRGSDLVLPVATASNTTQSESGREGGVTASKDPCETVAAATAADARFLFDALLLVLAYSQPPPSPPSFSRSRAIIIRVFFSLEENQSRTKPISAQIGLLRFRIPKVRMLLQPMPDRTKWQTAAVETTRKTSARKKPRRDNGKTSAAGPPTAQEAAALAQSHAPPDASVVQRILAELIQELERDGADAAKSSKLLNTYQVFLNAFDSDEAPQLGVFQCAIERNSLTMVQYLMESGGLDLELPGPHGLPPPLALACALGHIEIAKYLVRRGAQANNSVRVSVMAKCVSPLYFAASCGFLEIVKWLVELGADLGAADYHSMTSLHVAAASGHFQVMKYLLLADADANCKLWSGENVRSVAAGAGQLRIFEYLVEHKIGKLDRLGEMTDCLKPAVQDRQVGIVRYVLSEGEFARKQASDCLAMAIKGKQMEIFELLLSYKVLEGVEKVSRLQLLKSAIEVGLVGAVELLLQDGASVAQQITPIPPTVIHLNLQDGASVVEEIAMSNLAAVHLMAKVGNVPVLQLLERISTESPVDFDIRTVRHGLTPLHIAAFQGRMDAVRYLLSVLPSDYDVSFESNCHNTALNGAAEGGHIEIVKFLLSRGAAIQRHDGASALYRAALGGHFEIVQYLASTERQSTFSVAETCPCFKLQFSTGMWRS